MRTLRRSRRDLAVAAVAAGWLGPLLVLDMGAGVWFQRLLGVGTAAILVALLRGERPGVRAQVVGVVLAATAVEYTASPLLGVYTYRLHNVPLFVPPGHGLVYLAALALGRSAAAAQWRRPLLALALAAAGGWAVWGVLLAPRRDVLGAVLFVVFARFVVVGRAPLVYAGAFLVTTYLELLGTALGTWAWAGRDPLGVMGVGNPPSGIAGGYCFLDAVGLAAGPLLLAASAGARRARAPEPVPYPVTSGL